MNMAVEYTKTIWIDDETLLDENNLNHIETGIKDSIDEITKIENGTIIVDKASKDDSGNIIKSSYASSLTIEQTSSTGIVTIKLYSKNNTLLDTKTLDLDAEKIIQSVALDYQNKKLIFTLKDGTTINCDISVLIDTLHNEIVNETSRATLAEQTLQTNINAISVKIPTEASSSNQLADKEWVGINAGKIDKLYLNDVEQTITNKEVHLTVNKTTVDLSDVDNTSDLNKPISTATQTALTNEATTRSDADTALGNRIDTETSARTLADTTLQNNITAETTRAQGAEVILTASIQDIQDLIPAQASSSNQLADKAFINSSIATETANFLGTYDVVADLELQYGATLEQIVIKLNAKTFASKTNNDYTFVINKDSNQNTLYQKFKWVASQSTFLYEYTLNNSSFTANQWAAINSGITSTLVGKITTNEQAINTHISNTNNPHAVTKSQVGLGNVDNTSDADKPISTATQIALNLKADSSTVSTHIANTNNPHSVTKAQIGLGNVDNTSDLNKPISTATQTALTNEATTRSDADTALGNRIDTETSARTLADTTLQNNITAETTRAQGAEVILTASIQDIQDLIPAQASSSNQLADKEYVTTYAEPKDATILKQANVVNNVSSTSTTAPLSANQGKLLSDRIDNLSSVGRFLSIWNCTTGLPADNPTTMPYTYHTGDYFRVGTVGTTNYKPNGSTYTGAASTTVYTGEIATGDIWFFDGTNWALQINHLGAFVQDVKIESTSIVSSGIATIPYAGDDTAGVIKTKADYATNVTQTGYLNASTITYATYQSANNGMMVGKGTLDNVLDALLPKVIR